MGKGSPPLGGERFWVAGWVRRTGQGEGHRYSVRLVQGPDLRSPEQQCADSLLALVHSV